MLNITFRSYLRDVSNKLVKIIIKANLILDYFLALLFINNGMTCSLPKNKEHSFVQLLVVYNMGYCIKRVVLVIQFKQYKVKNP